MKRIAVVIDPWDFPFNGTVVSTRRFVNALEGQFEFVLLGTPAPGQVPDRRMVAFPRLSIPGFNAIINAMRAPLSRSNRRLLHETLSGCDLLHVQFPFVLGAGAITAARELGIPIICSFHVQPENVLRNVGLKSPAMARLLYKLFINAIYNRADRVIAPSQFALELLMMHGLGQPASVLSNGVPEMFFELPIEREGRDRFTVLSVGRLAGEKRHDIIIEAIARTGHRDRIGLHLVGAGPREKQLRAQAAAAGVDARIGAVSDSELMALYADADLFIHAGEIELEGMSVLEAMASGNVVLLSHATGSAATELISDSDLRFDPRQPDDLAGKIDRWLSDAAGRARAARDNRDSALGRTHAASVSRLADLYTQMLANRS